MNYRFQEHLPIYHKRDEIVNSIRSNQVTIISGETGSGKTTQLPLLCLEAGRAGNGKIIGCTQPRRIAATSLAAYVGSSFEKKQNVGYKIRFREQLNPDVKIKFMTDGILLAETIGDRLLQQYDTIIIDEAHERSINIDFLLGYMRWLLYRRPDLRLIISSATIDTKLFSRCFQNAPVIEVSGRVFSVEIRYKPVIELWKGESMDFCIEGVVSSVQEIIDSGEPGDILVFIPTIDDIYETINRLRQITDREGCTLYPLHSRMSAAAQQSIFEKSKNRKIVVATNIAETSITVPGIRFVIDTGLARMLRYEPSIGFSRMPIERISRASADQRTGRCGRVREGICIRLFSEQDYFSRPPYTTPELRRANLSGVILRMLRLGLGDAEKFPFPQHPSPKAIFDGYRQLRDLGAIDTKTRLTPLGKKMAMLPIDPPLSRMLIYAGEHGAGLEMLIIAAALSVDDPTSINHEENASKSAASFRHRESDFMSYLNLWTALNGSFNKKYLPASVLERFCKSQGLITLRMREWRDAYDQLKKICNSIPGFFDKTAKKNSYDTIHKSLLFGLKNGISYKVEKGLYHGVSGEIRVFPASTLFGKDYPWVLFSEIVETSKIYGRVAAAIKPGWIEELFKGQCRYTYKDPWFDEERGIVRAREEVTFKGLCLIKNRIVDLCYKSRDLAHEVFIRDALVKEQAGLRYRFIRNNRDVLQTIRSAERKLRTHIYKGDWALESFYSEHLSGVTSIRELNSIISKRGKDSFLLVEVNELLERPISDTVYDYPEQISIFGSNIPVYYNYKPGSDLDGVSVIITEETFSSVPLYYWEWLLPVFIRERINIFAHSIASKYPEKVVDPKQVYDSLLTLLSLASGPFLETLSSYVYNYFGIALSRNEMLELIPVHLWLNVLVKDEKGFVKYQFRPPIRQLQVYGGGDCQIRLSNTDSEFTGDWERYSFLKIAEVKVAQNLIPIAGIPALFCDQEKIIVRVFSSSAHAQISHAEALRHTLEKELAEKLAWELESFKLSSFLIRKYADFDKGDKLPDIAGHLFVDHVLKLPPQLPCDSASYVELYQEASSRIPDAGNRVVTLLEEIISAYESANQLLKKRIIRNKYADSSLGRELSNALRKYMEILFRENAPVEFIEKLPVYINSLANRIDLAFLEPVKYRRGMLLVKQFSDQVDSALAPGKSDFGKKAAWKMRLHIEDLAVFQFCANSRRGGFADAEKELLEKLESFKIQQYV